MALFGFGKKKNESEPQTTPEDAAERLKRAKEQASSLMSRKPKQATAVPGGAPRKVGGVSTRMRRPGSTGASAVIRRPSMAVQPQKAEGMPAGKAGVAASGSDVSQRKVRRSTENKLIGQLLLKATKISQQQLTKALSVQQTQGGALGQTLVQMGVCSKADVAAAISKQRTITTVDPLTLQYDKEALALLSRDFCERNRLIPFELTGNQLCIAMSNALDTLAKNEAKDLTQMHVKIFDAALDSIQSAIKNQYAGVQSAAKPAPSLAEAANAELAPKPEDIVIDLPEEDTAFEESSAAAAASLPDLPPIDDFIPLDDEESAELTQVADMSAVVVPGSEDVLAVDHAMHGGEIPSVGDLDSLDVSLIQECARTLWSGKGLKAIPLPHVLADEVVVEGKVDLLRLWMAEHEGRIAVPVCLPL